MLASTANAEYVALRKSKRDHSVSPSFHYRTPPRFNKTMTYDSPMLTPSPLKRHAPPSAEPMDTDDIFQSPAVSSSHTRQAFSAYPKMQIPTDDEFDEDEGFLLAPSSSSFSRSLITSTSPLLPRTPFRTPLKTPVKHSHRTPDRVVLSEKHPNTPSTMTPGRGAGTKRKPTLICTPLRNRTLTPLNVTSGTARQDDPDGMAFDRLAPLSAPRFVSRTPQTRAETEMHLKRQAETMTMLKISDLDRSGDESGYDSGPEVRREGDEGQRLFLGGIRTPFGSAKGKTRAKTPVAPSPGLEIFIRRGQANEEEVAEAVSPGGHVTKRRARSRPVSAELLESAQGTPTVFENQSQDKGGLGINSSKSASSVAFPSHTEIRSRTISSSSSETGSPISRQLTSGTMPRIRTQSHSQSRAPLNRLTSSSSATLFFGPSIPTPAAPKSTHKAGSKTRTSVHEPAASSSARPQMATRHSHPSPRDCPSSWARRDTHTLSPYSSPTRKRMDDDDDEADLFFNGPADTSFSFSVTEGTPSPKKKQRRDTPSPLPKKFRPRDSGIALDGSDDEWGPPAGLGLMPAMPRASTSVSTMGSDGDDRELVTPVFPTAASGWPGVMSLNDELTSGPHDSSGRGVDAFIMRALAAGAVASAPGDSDGEPKRVPGTPVKKVKTAHLVGGVHRPWQSAVTNKIGFPEFDEDPRAGGGAKGKGKGRKSLPAAFPGLGKENRESGKKARTKALAATEGDTDVEDDDASPSARKDGRYDGLGLGRPAAALAGFGKPGGKAHWLMRRSSSGAFSTSSEASNATVVTPTRNPKDWHLPPPRLPTQASPLKNSVDFHGKRSGSGSSSSTVTNSPTTAAASRHLTNGIAATSGIPQRTPTRPTAGGLFAGLVRPHTQVHAPTTRGRSSLGSGEEQPGRFEREFEEIDELGSGHFGRAMKVRYKRSHPGEEVFAVKKSKPFEGVKHRLRLREEVDILQHLAQASGYEGHPNVLAYIDNWEEDETLYIRTELCAFGNFAHFLWSYGRAFPRLDEARVWRVLAELSAGLRFIHDAGVLHLDLKPANIFVTDTGRLRIGDFGMAARWPRNSATGGFEREGDKRYLAQEVLQGRYGKAADVFSLGMTMLETATNIIVPDQGDAWHRLRHEDFCQVQGELDTLSSSLQDLLWRMMRMEPSVRANVAKVDGHAVVRRARAAMESSRVRLGNNVRASALGVVPDGFLEDILDNEWYGDGMDIGY